jgi:hypothetical protein
MKKDLLEDMALEIGYQYALFERKILSLSAKTMLEAIKQRRQGGTFLDFQNLLLGRLRKQLDYQKKVADALIRGMLIKTMVLNEKLAQGYTEKDLAEELAELQSKRTKSVELSEASIKSLRRMLELNDATTQAAIREGMRSHSAAINLLARDPRIRGTFTIKDTTSEKYGPAYDIANIEKAIVNNLQVRLNEGIPIVVQNTSYKFKVWAERNVRTQMNQQSLEVLSYFGQQAGVVFYLCSSLQDCADDHADWQGKIYVVENWQKIARPEYHTAIQNAIQEKDIKGFYWATKWENGSQEGPALTTRPNCRHVMKPMPITQVVNKTEEEMLQEQRMKRGTYDEKKYKDLQEQRNNERNIRKIKSRVDEYQDQIDNAKTPEAKQLLQQKINRDKIKLSQWQATQTKLVNSRQHLIRDPRRETVKIIVNDLGVRYQIKGLENL